MVDPNSIYDPRHTTGVSPVHKNVKHPLVYDPRRNPGQLHRGANAGRRPILALLIWLVFLLGLLAGAIWLFLPALVPAE